LSSWYENVRNVATNEVAHGPVSRRVVENVKALRDQLGWSLARLSQELERVGRPILATGLHRLEQGKRRIDADDLVGLALALRVTPARLLLPAEPVDAVLLTEQRSVSWQEAWRWVSGEQPLLEGGPIPLPDRRVEQFIRDNRPFESATGDLGGLRRELSRWLLSRTPMVPFEATVKADERGRITARIAVGGETEEMVDGGKHQAPS
jgi:transcriptional regulator with XRE-family HTH domain